MNGRGARRRRLHRVAVGPVLGGDAGDDRRRQPARLTGGARPRRLPRARGGARGLRPPSSWTFAGSSRARTGPSRWTSPPNSPEAGVQPADDLRGCPPTAARHRAVEPDGERPRDAGGARCAGRPRDCDAARPDARAHRPLVALFGMMAAGMGSGAAGLRCATWTRGASRSLWARSAVEAVLPVRRRRRPGWIVTWWTSPAGRPGGGHRVLGSRPRCASRPSRASSPSSSSPPSPRSPPRARRMRPSRRPAAAGGRPWWGESRCWSWQRRPCTRIFHAVHGPSRRSADRSRSTGCCCSSPSCSWRGARASSCARSDGRCCCCAAAGRGRCRCIWPRAGSRRHRAALLLVTASTLAIGVLAYAGTAVVHIPQSTRDKVLGSTGADVVGDTADRVFRA